MPILTQKAILNVVPGTTPQLTVHCSQSDTGSKVIFQLYAGSVPFEPDGTASVQGIRKDGTGFGPVAATISGNDVTVTLDATMTGVSGPSICELTITETDSTVSTANFALLVEPAAFPNGPLIENSVDVYQQILAYVQTFPATVAEDATAKVAAEAAIRAAADTALRNADDELSDQIAALQGAVGSPLVAATVAAMTDHDKIYVYTGSEAGYTAGNWYYWNGSAWASGGVYNAVAVNTDSTLSVPGMAADAAACGAVKTALEDQYNRKFDRGVVFAENTAMFAVGDNKYNPNTDYFIGRLKSDGTINAASTNYATSDYIDISGFSGTYLIIQVASAILSRGIAFYDADLALVSADISTIEAAVEIPAGAKYVRFSQAASTQKNGIMLFVSNSTSAIAFKNYGATLKDEYNGTTLGAIAAINAILVGTDDKTAVGKGAVPNATGGSNVGVGKNALYGVTTGSANTAIGTGAGSGIQTGSSNTLVGTNAAAAAESTSYGVAVGRESNTGPNAAAVGGKASASAAYSLAEGYESEAAGVRAIAIGKGVKANYAGSVAIGVDSTDNSAAATAQNDFVLGTAAHKVKIPGTIYDPVTKTTNPNPTYGSELVSDLTDWAGTDATYVNDQWEIAEGGTIAGAVTVEAGEDYLIVLTVNNAITPNETPQPCTITLGDDSITIFGANDANWKVILTPTNSGPVSITIGGGAWSGNVSAVSVKKITAYGTPVIKAQNIEVNGASSNVLLNSGSPKLGVTNSNNVGIGYHAQENLQCGIGNVGIGLYAQQSVKNGAHNVGIGEGAQRELTTGMYNFGIGYSAHRHLTTGNWNVALGNETSRDLTDGNNNVSIGRRAHNSLTHGNKNIAIGAQAGFVRSINGSASDAIATTTAEEQVLIGFQATQNSGTQSDGAIAIGARANAGADGIAIGRDVSASDNTVAIGSVAHTIILGGHTLSFNNDGTVTWS